MSQGLLLANSHLLSVRLNKFLILGQTDGRTDWADGLDRLIDRDRDRFCVSWCYILFCGLSAAGMSGFRCPKRTTERILSRQNHTCFIIFSKKAPLWVWLKKWSTPHNLWVNSHERLPCQVHPTALGWSVAWQCDPPRNMSAGLKENRGRILLGKRCADFHKWGYPSSWMVYSGQSF